MKLRRKAIQVSCNGETLKRLNIMTEKYDVRKADFIAFIINQLWENGTFRLDGNYKEDLK